MAGEQEWLTVQEVATRYRISRRTAYRWIASGRGLRIFRPGPTERSGIRVHRSSLERMERERQWGPASWTSA